MALRIGSSTPSKLYLGATEVTKAYLGAGEIYSSGGAAAWTPAALGADLAQWLDANDAATITLNGSNVSQWGDKSGNNRHGTQSTASYQPTRNSSAINGKAALGFDGTDDFLFAPDWTLTAPISVFAVVKSDDISATRHVLRKGLSGATSLELIMRHNGPDLFSLFVNGVAAAGITGTGLSTTAPAIHGLSYSGSVVAAHQNGTQYGSLAATDPIPNQAFRLRIGASYSAEDDNAAPTATWLGLIGEVLFVANASTDTRQRVEGYLAWKWSGLI